MSNIVPVLIASLVIIIVSQRLKVKVAADGRTPDVTKSQPVLSLKLIRSELMPLLQVILATLSFWLVFEKPLWPTSVGYGILFGLFQSGAFDAWKNFIKLIGLKF